MSITTIKSSYKSMIKTIKITMVTIKTSRFEKLSKSYKFEDIKSVTDMDYCS